MRIALFAALLITAFAAAPLYADKPDKPDKGEKKDREEQKDRKEHADRQADLSPWIQAWAKEGIKGRELTERLEKLMDQQRAGKLPPPPGAKERVGEKKEREDADKDKDKLKETEKQAKRPEAGPPFGRFGPPSGPGMRDGFGPRMRGGFGMRGGPGMGGFGRGGFMRGEAGGGQVPPEFQAQLRELKAQVARLHEEMARLERRIESDKPGKGPRDKDARPERPQKPRPHDKDDDEDHDKI